MTSSGARLLLVLTSPLQAATANFKSILPQLAKRNPPPKRVYVQLLNNPSKNDLNFLQIVKRLYGISASQPSIDTRILLNHAEETSGYLSDAQVVVETGTLTENVKNFLSAINRDVKNVEVIPSGTLANNLSLSDRPQKSVDF